MTTRTFTKLILLLLILVLLGSIVHTIVMYFAAAAVVPVMGIYAALSVYVFWTKWDGYDTEEIRSGN